MPLVILGVAGALVVWSSRRRETQQYEIHEFVAALLDDARNGRDLAPGLAGSHKALAAPLAVRLGDVIDRAGDTAMTILVSPGDTDAAGTLPSGASHTAMIHIGADPALGLRIDHDRDIVIIGYWTP